MAVRRALLCALGAAFLWGGVLGSRAALQFDVFLGYDGIVPEATWFPIVIEVSNDGPSFKGLVEVEANRGTGGETRRLEVELPTGTLKRLVIPVFSATRGYSSWDVRLFDERGKVRAEQTGLQPRKQIASDAPLLAGMARTPGGMPSIKPILQPDAEQAPATARLLPLIFPDNPLVLEGIHALYLNSEKATELGVTQVRALLAWLNAGGNLIVGVEQISEITATPWLDDLFPCELKDMQLVARHTELQDWLVHAGGTNLVFYPNQPNPRYNQPFRKRYGAPPGMAPGSAPSSVVTNNAFSELPDDFAFETNALQVAVGKLRDGKAVVTAEDTRTPLIVTANRGRGKVTVLLFSPEREPMRSWKNLPAFWAVLAEVPSLWYVAPDVNRAGGWSSDGIFGAMIDTRQVHRLPVGWLLLLLLVYLAVIGPLDQYWLKRIGKPMLTWITFPCYVVLFSLLIYFIGYKLRAGESEWNELHVVDVLLHRESVDLRGQTYASVYSPVNQKYLLEGAQKIATLRGEFAGNWRGGGGEPSQRATVWQTGDSFKAEIFVPVWTSQLFVSDWWQPGELPFTVAVAAQGEGWGVTVENRTDRKLTNLNMVVADYVIVLGDVAAKETKSFNVSKGQGTPLKDFVSQHAQKFQEAVQSRQSAFGASGGGHLEDLPGSAVAASFISQVNRQENPQNQYNSANFIAPPGLDLSSVVEHGRAVVLAWDGDYSPVQTMRRFSPRRSHQDTLWRFCTEVK